MVVVLKELLVLPVAPAMVVGAKQRRWCFDEVQCGNIGLQWGFLRGVSLVMAEPVGCQRCLYRNVEDAVVSPWLCSRPW